TPTALGVANDSIDIGYNDGAAVQTSSRAVQGTGANAASLSISDGPTYDYGTQASGSSTDKTFTVTNGGGVPASSLASAALAAPFGYKGGAYPGTGGTCGVTLAVAGSCSIVVTYAPVSIGATSSTITLNYFDGAAPQSAARNIQGTAVAPASLSISDSPTYDYGTQPTGASLDKVFTITNSGGFTA